MAQKIVGLRYLKMLGTNQKGIQGQYKCRETKSSINKQATEEKNRPIQKQRCDAGQILIFPQDDELDGDHWTLPESIILNMINH